MPTSNVVPLRQKIVAYSQGRITDAALWRNLFTHEDWLVPVTELTGHYRPSKGGDYALPGDGYLFDRESFSHPKHLFLFTDPEPAHHAKSKGIPLGMFSSGMGGVEVFGKINPKWEGVMVNPGSPQEETWFIPRDSFASLASFAETFRLEEEFTRLARMSGPPSNEGLANRLFERLREFQRFEVPVRASTGGLLAVNDGQSPMDEVVICTWPDCIEAVKTMLTPPERADIKKMILDGDAIFKAAMSNGYAVIAINPCGPGAGLKLELSDGSGPNMIRHAWPPG